MPRFSLRSFFLFLFVACLIGSNIFTATEVRRLNEKLNQKDRTIEKLQVQVGELVITDPNKLHAVAIPSYEDLTWRWRLHVPDNTTHLYRFATHDVPETGIPASPDSFPLDGGDYELTAAIRKDRNDDWALNVFAQRDPFGRIGLRREQTFALDPDHSQWAARAPGSSSRQAGCDGTESMTPGEAMVLLRHRIMRELDDGSSSTVPEPCDGVMIWIVERGK